jgi:spermidine synthase
METGIFIALSLNLLIGLIFLLLSSYRTIAVRTAIAVIWISLSILFEWWSPPWNKDLITMGPYMYFSEYQKQLEEIGQDLKKEISKYTRLIYFKEGVSATISVRKQITGELSLQVNGKTDASSGADMSTQELIAHIPILLHPEPRDVLVVGLASGVTVGSVEKYPVETITCVEISPAMIEASNIFRRFNGNALDDPRLTLLIEDGRNHVLLAESQYDVIISQPTNPWISGVGNLFTREYFQLLDDRLRDDGTACVWLQAYGLEPDDFKMIVRTFNDIFPYTALWESLVGKDYILVGQKRPFQLSLDEIERNFDNPDVRKDLERIGVLSPGEFLKFLIVGPSQLRAYAGTGKLHTDDNSRLEFSCPKAMYTNTILLQLEAVAPFRENPLMLLTGGTDELLEERKRELNAVIRARAMTVEAVLAMNRSDIIRAESFLRMALTYFPGEDEARYLLTRHNAQLIVRHLGLGNWKELEAISRATLDLDKENFPGLDGLSTSLINLDLFEDAIPFLEKGARAYPDYAPFHANLGYAYARLDRHEEAVAPYETAVSKDPYNARYAFDLGLLYFNQGRVNESIEYYRRATLIEPSFIEAHINLGSALARLGKLEEARQSFRRALNIDPDNELVLRNLRMIDTQH